MATWVSLPVQPVTDKTLKTAVIDTTSIGDTTLVAAVTGKRIRVYAIVVVATLAVAIRFKSAGNSLSGAMALGINGGFSMTTLAPNFILQTNVGEALILNLGLGVQVSGFLAYWDDE